MTCLFHACSKLVSDAVIESELLDDIQTVDCFWICGFLGKICRIVDMMFFFVSR